MRYRFVVLAGAVLMLAPLAAAPAFGQARGANPGRGQAPGQGQPSGRGRGRGAPPPPSKPTPREADGHVNLGQVQGDPPGLWDAR